MSAFKNYLDLEMGKIAASKKVKITKSECQKWRTKVLTFDLLKGLAPGVSFCQYFHVIDFILIFHQSDFDYLTYIKKTYVT
jgi:hypothetical protein